jgi:hypothetical protein|tara:strand:- start:155 stop:472 length:318 start_codon:yes stop_codon:yes gene_type:complete
VLEIILWLLVQVALMLLVHQDLERLELVLLLMDQHSQILLPLVVVAVDQKIQMEMLEVLAVAAVAVLATLALVVLQHLIKDILEELQLALAAVDLVLLVVVEQVV